MSLRDWVAGQALAGLLRYHQTPVHLDPLDLATAAYQIADAMLYVAETSLSCGCETERATS